ncbi:MAG: hypothetical protein LBT30_03275 [Clostridiales bacterium]|nr:hypothetical protein [Clostridiales bacterium]
MDFVDSAQGTFDTVEFDADTPIALSENDAKLIYIYKDTSRTYSFTPTYSANYSITHNMTDASGNYYKIYRIINGQKNYIYDGETATNIYLEAGICYYPEIYKTNGIDYDVGYVSIAMERITPNITKQININGNKTSAYILNSASTQILNMESSNGNVKINRIIDKSTGEITAVNGNILSYRFVGGKNYIIEVQNIAIVTAASQLFFKNPSDLPDSTNIDPNDIGLYYKFTATETGSYVFTFKYGKSNLAIDFLDDYAEFTNINTTIGSGYKMIVKHMNAGQTIYVKIADLSNVTESVNIVKNKIESAYQWIINGNVYTQDTINMTVGSSLTLALRINGSIDISMTSTDLMIINNGQYCKIEQVSNKITISADTRIGSSFTVLAQKTQDPESDFYGKIFTVVPIASNAVTFNYFNDNDSTRMTYANSTIKAVRYSIIAPGFDGSIIETSSSTINLTQILNGKLCYKTAKIQIIALKIEGKNNNNVVYQDWISNGTFGISIASKDVSGSYGGGNGTVSEPYLIDNIRHFQNINLTNQSGIYYKQTNHLNFSNTATPRNITFRGIYNGNSKFINNIKITSTATTGNVGGLFDYNYGTIENILEFTVTIILSGNTWFGVNVGGIVGANSGTINGPVVLSGSINAGKNSEGGTLGGVAGINLGIIKNGTNSMTLEAYGDIGGFVGINYGDISSVIFKGKINFYQRIDAVNRSAGGVLGCNVGTVANVSVSAEAKIKYSNTSASDSMTLSPHIGIVVGYSNGGTMTLLGANGSVDLGVLKLVSQTTGILFWKKTVTWDQKKNAGNRAVGFYV